MFDDSWPDKELELSQPKSDQKASHDEWPEEAVNLVNRDTLK